MQPSPGPAGISFALLVALKEIIDDWERQPPNLAQEPT